METVSREPVWLAVPTSRASWEKTPTSDGGNVRRTMLRSPCERPSSGFYWIKSSLSYANGNCVEVASLPCAEIGVRNSKNSGGPVLRFTPDEWHAFLEIGRAHV